MKSIITITAIFIFSTSILFAQSDLEIGSVYIKRAEQSFLDKDLNKAYEYYEKGMSYIKETSNSKVARIGALLSYEIKDFVKAKILVKRYFDLEFNKTSDEYLEMLDFYVAIDDALIQKEVNIENERLAEEQKQKELKKQQLILVKQKKQKDSLTNIWNKKAQKFTVAIDDIGTFNKYNVAIYKSSGNLGIMDDFGTIIVKADDYSQAIQNQGFILLLNDLQRPSRILCYNAKTKEIYQLPDVSEFNIDAYDYGKIMLPRINGMLVSYPEKTKEVIVFNLITRELQAVEDKKELLKALKKDDVIDKFDKDFKVRIEKEWYSIGSTVGAGYYPMFSDDKILQGFLSKTDAKVHKSDVFSYLGSFCDGKFQAIVNDKTFWVDNKAISQDAPKNINNVYSGTAKFTKNSDGKYQIYHTKDGVKKLVLGNQSLDLLEQFLEESSK